MHLLFLKLLQPLHLLLQSQILILIFILLDNQSVVAFSFSPKIHTSLAFVPSYFFPLIRDKLNCSNLILSSTFEDSLLVKSILFVLLCCLILSGPPSERKHACKYVHRHKYANIIISLTLLYLLFVPVYPYSDWLIAMLLPLHPSTIQNRLFQDIFIRQI